MSLQLGPGPVRGPRADCYTDAHLAPCRPEDRRAGVHAGFWHIVQLSRSPELPLLMSGGPPAASQMPSWPRYKVNPRRRE
jgi:hypothetical protein